MNLLHFERQVSWTSRRHQQGSVLMVAMMTITILTMICATSLYVTSQNSTVGMQTAAWQQSLTGAETGVDLAIAALNNGAWSNWRSVTAASPPSAEPSPAPTVVPTGPPDSSHYNLLPSSAYPLTMPTPCEGATIVTNWVTIDTGGMLPGQDTNGKQWYRIRSTGQANLVSPARVSSNKLDSDLRNTIGLRFNRKASAGTMNTLGPSRSIEVILQPVVGGGWARAVTLKNSFNMSGGGIIDSFDSSNPFMSTGGAYDVTKRQSHGDVGTLNSTSSDLKSTFVYGGLSYSGPAVKNATNVQGAISTPFSATISTVSAPTWSGGFTSYSAGSPPFTTVAAGTKANPLLVKVNGNFTVPGGQTVTITAPNSGTDNNYVIFWVTGTYTTSGSGMISQAAGVNATWYVGGDMTTSGGSYNNLSGRAANVSFIGYGPAASKATISGSGAFVGTLNMPNYDMTISGTGALTGAIISNSLLISGGASIHYDQALASSSSTVGNYAFASWFEDNSDKTRGLTY
jgi:hypothetical protein